MHRFSWRVLVFATYFPFNVYEHWEAVAAASFLVSYCILYIIMSRDLGRTALKIMGVYVISSTMFSTIYLAW